MGIGLATYVEVCGFGPWEMGSVYMDENAKVTILTGSSPHGQGHETTWVQIAADALQIPPEDIVVLHGDTSVVPRGIGTFGSRSTAVAGSSVHNNAIAVRDKARQIAAHLLEAALDDCGVVINPLLVEGQIHGGIAQGVGRARYDEMGNLISGSLLDYAVPRCDNFVPLETHRTETPTPLNPLGVKGIGEAATIGTTPTIVNAVLDALAHLGIHTLDMPLTAEKLWRAIQQAHLS